jgi:hypothetical protein
MKPRSSIAWTDKLGSAKRRDPWWLGPLVFVVVLAACAAAPLWAVFMS